MKKERNYILPEDQILLDELKAISANTSEISQLKMVTIQTKAMLRNKKAMVDIDKSNKRTNEIILGFALIQIMIPFVQSMLGAIVSINPMSNIISNTLLGVFIVCSLYLITKK